MSFTITRTLDQLPSFPMVCKLAEQIKSASSVPSTLDHSRVVACMGITNSASMAYAAHSAAHGVKGEFSFAIGKAAVT